MEKSRVVVIGGGVAGMSAAHELAERGFEVEVFERNPEYVGGKARSVDVPGTNLQSPDKYLPGEHGFRFFPGFYKHVTDTMRRTPYRRANGGLDPNGCLGNLTSTSTVMVARYDKEPIITVANFPRSVKGIRLIVHDMFGVDTGLTLEEEEFFALRLWQLMTSCRERRDTEYEKLSWWDYLQADRFTSKAYRSLLVAGLTRTLVAAQASSASTKTGGDILLQLLFTMMTPGKVNDRVLNGPTNDRWLTPWYDYLCDIGVAYDFGRRVTGIQMTDGRISEIVVSDESGEERITADHFVLAVPVERAAELMTDEMIAGDPSLGNVCELAKSVSWMNGIMFYLNEDPSITRGHIIFTDSEWALTGISQPQFWGDYEFADRFNGKVKGLLSVDISDWLHTEYRGVLAENAKPEEVKELVWDQIVRSLNTGGQTVVSREMIEHWYLDRDIEWESVEHKERDYEPLLVNTVDSWALRPEAVTAIPNLFLASDYVRTNTDLATMEGANEAARRAVNGILEASESQAQPCQIWELEEPVFFAPLKWLDRRRFKAGKPWEEDLPLWLKVFLVPWTAFFGVGFAIRSLLSVFRGKFL